MGNGRSDSASPTCSIVSGATQPCFAYSPGLPTCEVGHEGRLV